MSKLFTELAVTMATLRYFDRHVFPIWKFFCFFYLFILFILLSHFCNLGPRLSQKLERAWDRGCHICWFSDVAESKFKMAIPRWRLFGKLDVFSLPYDVIISCCVPQRKPFWTCYKKFSPLPPPGGWSEFRIYVMFSKSSFQKFETFGTVMMILYFNYFYSPLAMKSGPSRNRIGKTFTPWVCPQKKSFTANPNAN